LGHVSLEYTKNGFSLKIKKSGGDPLHSIQSVNFQKMELDNSANPVMLITHIELEISKLKDVTTMKIEELARENETLKQQCKDMTDVLNEKENEIGKLTKELHDRNLHEYHKAHMMESFSVKHLLVEMKIQVSPRHYKILGTNISSIMKAMGKHMSIKNRAMHYFEPDKDLLNHLILKELSDIFKSEGDAILRCFGKG
jgi:hypothetical protein